MKSQRNTFQREAVYEAVKTLGSHPSASEVYAYVNGLYPTISRSTVYRNLGQLCEDGRLRRITNPEGAERYDHETLQHYHIFCRKCGGVYNIKTLPMPYLAGRVTEIGAVIENCDIIFRGLCPECSGKRGFRPRRGADQRK